MVHEKNPHMNLCGEGVCLKKNEIFHQQLDFGVMKPAKHEYLNFAR